jgi:hypothetical protein
MLELAVLVALSLLGGQQPPLSRIEVTASGMTIVRQPQTHVLVARNADGGTMSTSCTATGDLLQELHVPAIAAAKAIRQETLAATKITILNADQPGLGFNDPTPATPVGGNPGTTLGEQRLNAFRHAAQIWERAIDSPVEIQILATFAPIRNSDPCTATSGVLGAATSWSKVADFENAPMSGVTFPIALANKLAGRDLQLGEPDIQAFFNADVDNSSCLGERNWYYGLDGNNGIHADFVVVLLHELAHGLGMSGTMNVNSGVFFGGKPSIFEVHALDLVTGQRFDQLTAAQRKAAVINGNQTVWDGTRTRDAAARLLDVSTTLRVTSAATGTAAFEINPASFGPPAGLSSIAARIVAPLDAADAEGPTTTDGCSAYTNPAEVAGRVALVDRGTCTFVQKALRAQEAGALAVVVANQEPCGLSPMGGESTDVRIPAVGINRTDGNAIRQLLAQGTADASVSTDPSSRSGASQAGYVRLFVPCEVEPGSSMYHWDRSTTPNLLMEPNINEDLTHGLDLTVSQLLDIGWTQAGPSGRRVLRR